MSSKELREKIADRAHAIWEGEGRPNDRTLAHWLQAEAEVGAETTGGVEPVASAPAPKAKARSVTRTPRVPK